MDGAGSVADWITTAVAALAVVLAWRASTRSNALQAQMIRLENAREDRTEQREAARAAADERAAQADLVAAWAEEGEPERRAGSETWSAHPGWRVVVSNASLLPVYELWVVGMGPEVHRTRGRQWVGTVRPSQQLQVGFPPFVPEFRVASSANERVEFEEGPMHIDVALEFVDAAGRSWFRDGAGVLHKTADPTA